MLGKKELMNAFVELTNCCHPVWDWVLDGELRLLRTNCPEQEMYMKLFLLKDSRRVIEEHLQKFETPLVCTMATLISWVLVSEKNENEGAYIYIKGPFFTGYKDEENCNNIFRILKLNEEEKRKMWRSLQKIPMIASSTVLQYAMMMHYCIRQEKIAVADIEFGMIRKPYRKIRGLVQTDQFDDSSGYWEMEYKLLDMIRRGDMGIVKMYERMAVLRPEGQRYVTRDIEKAKRQNHNLLTLVSRAAVDGGLARKTSFSLASDYRKKIEGCTSPKELAQLNAEMCQDYTERVHNAKASMQSSAKIRLCCEYIDTHLDEKISLEILAEKCGYTVSHLSRKFKEEVGCSIVAYMQKVKLEKAKQLLVYTEKEVEEISGELGFGTRSYFSTVFRRQEGMTPTEYRQRNRII